MKIILPSLNIFFEKWKYNKEFKVFVSNRGNFKGEDKVNLPVKIGKGGYVYIMTPRGVARAHRLVMYTWKPIPNREAMTVDHLNHNKRDNSVVNLEWVTKEENLQRAEDDLLISAKVGEKLCAKNIKKLIKLKGQITLEFNKMELASYLRAVYNLIKDDHTKGIGTEKMLRKIEYAEKDSFKMFGVKIRKIGDKYLVVERNLDMVEPMTSRKLITEERWEKLLNEEE